MCRDKELQFIIFIIHSLSDSWKKAPAAVYRILNTTGILDDYIITCYDPLHTLGKEYLVEDITEYVTEKGFNVQIQNTSQLSEAKLHDLDFNAIVNLSISENIEIRKAIDLYYGCELSQIDEAEKIPI